MGTLVGSIAERLVGGDAVHPHVINFLWNPWQSRVSFVLKAIGDGQFVHRENLVSHNHWEGDLRDSGINFVSGISG
uniref:Uncharacterized protein n=1 Tax=Romanomermis culicivorax TaxID=13658 RepID=A0A915J4T2_ROMCU